MSITPSGVHEKTTLVFSDSLCESLWAFLDDNVSPSLLTWDTGINLLSGIIEELGHNDIALEFGLTNLTLDAAAVHGNITKICKLRKMSVYDYMSKAPTTVQGFR